VNCPQEYIAEGNFKARVTEESRGAIPLGAYAFGNDIHYAFVDARGTRLISQTLAADRRTNAISSTLPLYSWDEREMHDEWDVRFTDLPDPRPLRAVEGTMPAAVTAVGEGLTHFVVGPVHAGIIEAGRFTFSSGGESVVHLDAQLSFGHRGVEHRLAGMPVLEAARFVARICGGCSASRSMAYAQALENLAGAEIDPWADLTRLVLLELERVYNHLHDLAAASAGAGWGPGFARGMALKESAMRLCALATGHRLLFDAIVPGGVGWSSLEEPDALLHGINNLREDVERYVNDLFGNASVVARWHGAGKVSRETLRAFGALGPARRAGGDNVDLRAILRYGGYRWFQLTVASALSSDAFARCCVKRDELQDSMRLIRESLTTMRNNPPVPAPPLGVGPGTSIGAVEGPRGIETVAVHVDDHKRLDRIHIISASYRNWPVVARSMDGNIVPDFPLINKSFNLCYACADR
jgi:Ni,Fe-hydrogenase III large subunit